MLENARLTDNLEYGCGIFLEACGCEHFAFAEWVLQKFPIAPNADDLSEFIEDHIYTVQFLVETFDLGWAEVSNAYYINSLEHDNKTMYPRSIAPFRWIEERFALEIDREDSLPSLSLQ